MRRCVYACILEIVYVCACMRVCVNVSMHVFVCVCVYRRLCVVACMRACVHAHVFAHVCLSTFVCEDAVRRVGVQL